VIPARLLHALLLGDRSPFWLTEQFYHLSRCSNKRDQLCHRPLRWHDKSASNQILQSERSRRLMSDARLCAKCNNETTQPYDRAWEAMSDYLRNRWSTISRERHFDLARVFPGSAKKGALHVHLYFVKLFGCRVAESNIQLNLGPFSSALRTEVAHPNVYLQIGDTPGKCPFQTAGISEIHAEVDPISGRPIIAMWMYTVGEFAVRIGYLEPRLGLRVWPRAWHPATTNKLVHLHRYID
jgi:hypothetical protein